MQESCCNKTGTYVDSTVEEAHIPVQTAIRWGIPNCSIYEITQILYLLSKLSKSQLYSHSWYWYNQLVTTLNNTINLLGTNTLQSNFGFLELDEFKKSKLTKYLEKFNILCEKVQHIRSQDARKSLWNNSRISRHLHWLGELANKHKNYNNLELLKENNLDGISWSERLLKRMEASIMVIPDVNQCVGHAFAFAFLQQVIVEPAVSYESKLYDCLDKITNIDKGETEFGQNVGYEFQMFHKTSNRKDKLNSLKTIKKMLPNLGSYIIKLARLQRMGKIWCNAVLSISVGNTCRFLNGLLPIVVNLIRSLANKFFLLGPLIKLKDGKVSELSNLGEYIKRQGKKIYFSNKVFDNLYELLNASWRIVVITSILVPSSKTELINIVEHKYGTTLEALRRDVLSKKNDVQEFEWPSNLSQDISSNSEKKDSILVSLFDTLDEYWNTCAELHPELYKLCIITNQLRKILILLELPITSPVLWQRFKPIVDLNEQVSGNTFVSVTKAIIEGVLGNPSNDLVEWDYMNYQQLKLCGIDAASINITNDYFITVEQNDLEDPYYALERYNHLNYLNNVPLCGVCALPVSTESTVKTHCSDFIHFKYAPKSVLVRGRWYHETCLELFNSELERETHSLFVIPKIKVPVVI